MLAPDLSPTPTPIDPSSTTPTSSNGPKVIESSDGVLIERSTVSADGSSTEPNPDAPASPSPKKPSKRTTVEELRSALGELGLDAKGKKDSLYKRLLKAFYKTEEPDSEAIERTAEERRQRDLAAYEARLESAQETWRSFLCFDVEATCRGGREYDWPNEVIEFPVVLLQWKPDESGRETLQRVDTFHTYVRPTWQPILTEFCTALTGITQDMVDRSPTFPEMVRLLETWMDKHGLRDEDGRLKDAVWVTDGPWDLRDFIPKQLYITPTDPPFPPYFFGQYLNIKQATQTVLSEFWYDSQAAKEAVSSTTDPSAPSSESHDPFHDGDSAVEPARSPSTESPASHQSTPTRIISTNRTMTKQYREGKWKGPNYYFPLPGQLQALGLGEFEGRQHSGLDDATNISRILIAISQKPRVIIEPNARTPSEKHIRRYPWMGAEPGQVKFEEWMSTSKATVYEGKTYGGTDQTGGKPAEKQTEWVLKEDAAGRFVCVKVEVKTGGYAGAALRATQA